MYNNFIHQLRIRLNENLPGALAQDKMAPSIRFTGKVVPNTGETRESSVLVLIYPKGNELYLPFIQRPDYDGAHGGQISLPGGKLEPHDKNLLDTALRESQEEIGVNPDNIQTLGSLTPIYIPNSNYNVTPYIAYLPEPPQFVPDPFEVDSIIEASLSRLIAPETIEHFVRNINGHTIRAPFFNIDNRQIWGATAMIISELKDILLSMRNSIPSGFYSVHNDQVSR